MLLIIGLTMCVFLNLLVIVVLLKKGWKINYMGVFMISLAISDILQAGIGYAVEVHSYFTIQSIGKLSCIVSGFSVTFFGLVSIAHLAGIAIERHLILRYPMRMRAWLNVRCICLYVIIPSWLYGFLWAFFPLIGWNRYTKQSGMSHSCGLDMTNTSINYTSYTYNLLFWCFAVPVGIISYCSYSIYRSLRLQRVQSDAVDLGDGVGETRRKMERQQTMMSFVMIGTFILAWSPYAGCVLVLTIRSSVPDLLLKVSALFAKTSTLYNPIIYSIFVEEFRNGCKKLFGCYLESPVTEADFNIPVLHGVGKIGEDGSRGTHKTWEERSHGVNKRVEDGLVTVVCNINFNTTKEDPVEKEKMEKQVKKDDISLGRKNSKEVGRGGENEDKCDIREDEDEKLPSFVRRTSTNLTQLTVFRNDSVLSHRYNVSPE